MNYYSVLGKENSLIAMRLMNIDRDIHRRINERAVLSRYRQADGTMYVRVYSMDCDCVEGVTFKRIPCNWWTLEKAREEQEKWAEGPCSIWPVHTLGCTWSRDRIMEAYEDGHAWSV